MENTVNLNDFTDYWPQKVWNSENLTKNINLGNVSVEILKTFML